MKYAEGPATQVEVSVAAPPERLWPPVTDITLTARFSPELQRAGWLDGASALSTAVDAKPEREDAIVAFRLRELNRGMLATVEGLEASAERPD